MKTILLIAILIANVYTQAPGDTRSINPSNCGLRPLVNVNRDSPRIVGGEEAIKGDWGWTVAMKYNKGFMCGGSLLNSQWIITGLF